MPERDAVLFANEAFYRAFADRDVAAMEALWSREAPVACIHPGWSALVTRRDVIESWRRILTNENAPQVACREPSVFVHGDIAFVVCYEEIDGNYLVATNVFRREGRQWKLVHHQAGPTAYTPTEGEDEELEPAPRIN
jgi:ketosteroid isomerase-like protein